MNVRRSKKRFLYAICFSLLPITVGLMDWERFFRVSAHADLGREIFGECTELVVISAFIAALMNVSERIRKSPTRTNPTAWERLFLGVGFAIWFEAFSWRDFFQSGQFEISSGIDGLVGSAVAGTVMGLLFSVQKAKERNLTDEAEKPAIPSP